MKKRPTNDDSDEFDVDEPEEFDESGSDWDPDLDEDSNSKKRKSRGKVPSRKATTKKKKVEKSEDDEDEEENEDEEEEGEEEEESEDEGSGQEESGANGTTTPKISIKAFTNGSFVVLKTDLQSDGDPPLWKIDGKALLQKYVPFKGKDGETLYKNTSTYSGWTQNNRNQYAPAPVTYVQQGKREIIIEFNRDKVKLDDDEQTPAADGEKNEAQAATA